MDSRTPWESFYDTLLVVYTDPNSLRDDPEGAVRTLERVFSHSPEELMNELVWLDQWQQ